MFPLIMAAQNLLITLHFIIPSQECYHWIKPVGIRVSIAEFDINYGVGLSVP